MRPRPTPLQASTPRRSSKTNLDLYRDEHYYGDVKFSIYNTDTETYLCGVNIGIAGQETVSNDTGYVSVFIPLEKQQQYYIVACDYSLGNDTVYVPCGTSDVVLVK